MVRTRIYLAVAVLVVLGVLVMLHVYRGLGDVAGHLAKLEEVEAPFSIAAVEMEKNTGEFALGVLQYVARPAAGVRAEAANDRADFFRYHGSYMRLASSQRKRDLGRHVAAEFRRLVDGGHDLMRRRDALDAQFLKVTERLEGIDRIIDDDLQPRLRADVAAHARVLSALTDVEAEAAEIGFWLAVHAYRPDALSRGQVLDKLDELDDALRAYMRLAGSADARRSGGDMQAHVAPLRAAAAALFEGEAAMTRDVDAFVRLHEHIDAVFDEEIQRLASSGLSQPQAQADLTTESVLSLLRIAIPLYALLALVVGTLLSLSIVRPLKRLALGTRAIGERDLSYRIPVHGKGEFEDLARQFNAMVERLQESTVSRGLLEANQHELRATVAELRQEIHDRRQAEREREALELQLRRSEAMAAMGSLVAGVAHEVRNPLFGITATLDAMEADLRGEPLHACHQRVLRREVTRLNRLMTSLLEYGRPPGTDLAPGPLPRLIAEAVQVCGPVAEAAGVAVASRLGDAAVEVPMQPARLLQVFVNLIENAVQHAPAGSTVEVRLRVEADADGRDWAHCEVLDAGSGFSDEDLAHVFTPFFTRRRKGTGLGLAIVQRIVEEHGGSVVAGNRPGGGACLQVRLPCVGG
ncbi:MAG TPA: ATP-binding protein [Lysobacter sp.]